jgi:hypothetical protein
MSDTFQEVSFIRTKYRDRRPPAQTIRVKGRRGTIPYHNSTDDGGLFETASSCPKRGELQE